MLWLAALSFAFSVGFLAFAGEFPRAIPKLLPNWGATLLFWTFAAVQFACLVTLVWRSGGSRHVAGLLVGFCAPYALFSCFCAYMSLSGDWI